MGEGFVAGNKYLQESRNLEMGWNKNQAEIANLSAEARSHDADVGLKVSNLQIARMGMQIKIQAMRDAGFNVGNLDGSGGAGTGAGGPGTGGGALAPLPALGGGTGAGAGAAAPGAGAGPPTVAGGAPAGGAAAQGSEFQTSYQALAAEYKKLQNLEIAGVVQPGAAALVRNQMTEAQKTGRIITPDGRTLIDPSFVSQEAGEEQRKRAGGTYGEEASKEMSSEEAETADKQAPLQEQLQRLDDASTLLNSFKPGAGAQSIAEAQNIARRWGFDLGDPSAVMQFVKLSSEASFDVVRSMKGQVRNMELQGAGKQVFSPDLTDQANRYLIDRLRGAVKQSLDYTNAFQDWRTGEGKSALSPNMFRAKWFKDNPYKGYIDQGLTTPKPAKGPTERPESLPSSAVHQTSSQGRARWFDPTSGKAWNEDGTPQ
jgi:hypothetical protein